MTYPAWPAGRLSSRDIRRLGLGVRNLIMLEQSVIDLVAPFGVHAVGRRDAPGVYVGGRKLASDRGYVSGIAQLPRTALSMDMDLEPFAQINPCGMVGSR